MSNLNESWEWLAWEMFTGSEANAWWLMMCVFTFTCITFICTNITMRNSLKNIETHIGVETQHSLLYKIRVWFYKVFFLRVYKK